MLLLELCFAEKLFLEFGELVGGSFEAVSCWEAEEAVVMQRISTIW